VFGIEVFTPLNVFKDNSSVDSVEEGNDEKTYHAELLVKRRRTHN